MAMHYGALRGRVDIFKREDDLSTPHLQIRIIDGQNQTWRIAVNVLSGDQSRVVFHRVDPLQSHPVLAGLAQLGSGFTEITTSNRSAASALDYFRAPLFDWPTGVAVPSTGPGASDDLQDMLVTYLKQLHDQGGEIFAFGAKFPEPGEAPNPRPIDNQFKTKQGIHDIHMNQGNPAGAFAGDNGVFQDGGLILKFPNRHIGLFLRFQTQWLPTDDVTGHRSPNAQPIPPGGGAPPPGGEPAPAPPPSPVGDPDVYIERALINPAGDDVGKEAVVLGNVSTGAVDIGGWRIIDKNNNFDTLQGTLAPGESLRVLLTGSGAQLGNSGGTIALVNRSGTRVHAVSYAKDDIGKQARYIRFIT
jgi:uncharacterized protein YukJ